MKRKGEKRLGEDYEEEKEEKMKKESRKEGEWDEVEKKRKILLKVKNKYSLHIKWYCPHKASYDV